LLILLLMLTGARPMEIATAKRSWVKAGVLYLPDSKGGRKVIVLPEMVIQLLAETPSYNDYLCGVRTRPGKAWDASVLASGVRNVRLYDLRHSWASEALDKGYTLPQIGKVMGHKSPLTTDRYAHLLEGRRAEITDATANQIGKKTKVA
jgi:integrase